MKSVWLAVLDVSLVVLLFSCGGGEKGNADNGNNTDSGISDTGPSKVDGGGDAHVDAGTGDVTCPDVEIVDVQIQDAEYPDAKTTDASFSDAETPDVEVPDSGLDTGGDPAEPDAEVPDSGLDTGVTDAGPVDGETTDGETADGGSDTGPGDGGTGPIVLSVYPAVGAVDMPENTMVMVTFDRPMDTATIDSATFTLMTGATTVNGAVSSDGLTATFIPAASLSNSQAYDAKVAGSVKDASGNTLGTDIGWTFSVAPPATWTSAIQTDAPGGGDSVTVDKDGNIYVAGTTTVGIDGNVHVGVADGFLVKLNSSGVRQWTRQFGTAKDDVVWGMAMETDNNIYLTGSTQGDLDGNILDGSENMFLIKYNSSGDKQWTRQTAFTYFRGYRVAVANTGEVYVVGSASSGPNSFLLKYSPSGDLTWARQFGTTGGDRPFGVSVAKSGDVYVTGYTPGSMDGNVSSGGFDIFLVKYSDAGDKQWTKQYGTAGDDIGEGVSTDSAGNIYIAGTTGGNLNGEMNHGGRDAFLMKCDENGAVLWTRLFGSKADDNGFGLSIYSDSNIYVTGATDGSFDGNIGGSPPDVLLVMFDTTGNRLWTRIHDGPGGGSIPNWNEGISVAVDSGGNAYVTGEMKELVLKFSSNGVRQ